MRVMILIAMVICGGCASVGHQIDGVGNFDRVEDGVLYRGAQPSPRGLQTLAHMGVKTDINLRNDAKPAEAREAEQAGLKYVLIPMSPRKADAAQIDEFLQAVQTMPRPIFVHCKAGCDRTGLDVAVYRIVAEGWSKDQALRDLYAHGYHWALFPSIARYVRKFEPVRLASGG